MGPRQKDAATRPRLGWKLVALLAIALVIAAIVKMRDERANRREIELVNEAEVPMSVQYTGYYGQTRTELAPGQRWKSKCRSGDGLMVEAVYGGRKLLKGVPLFEPMLDTHPQGTLLLMQAVSNTQRKGTTYMNISAKEPETEVKPELVEISLDWGPQVGQGTN